MQGQSQIVKKTNTLPVGRLLVKNRDLLPRSSFMQIRRFQLQSFYRQSSRIFVRVSEQNGRRAGKQSGKRSTVLVKALQPDTFCGWNYLYGQDSSEVFYISGILCFNLWCYEHINDTIVSSQSLIVPKYPKTYVNLVVCLGKFR